MLTGKGRVEEGWGEDSTYFVLVDSFLRLRFITASETQFWSCSREIVDIFGRILCKFRSTGCCTHFQTGNIFNQQSGNAK